MRISPCFGALAVMMLGCASPEPDPPSTGEPSPLGTDLRIRDLLDPESPNYPARNPEAACGAPFTMPAAVSGAVVNWVDTFDETHDGKSRGTIYVQDFGATGPYSGISIFSPSFVPGDLRVAPGDVLDLRGSYQENACIGAAVFDPGQVLQQLAYPICTFRFDGAPATPIEIPASELESYETARKWFGMLVTVKDLTIGNSFTNNAGRFTANFRTEGNPAGDRYAPALSNELWDLNGDIAPVGKHFVSATGIVTWFFNPPKLATRSRADLVEDAE